jgi:hypothetical protein
MTTFKFYDQDHHLNPTLPMKEYLPPEGEGTPEQLRKWDAVTREPNPTTSGECTCDNASGLHWGKCPLNMKTTATTDEWTPVFTQQVRLPDGTSFECSSETHRDKAISTHNAALAAERERGNDFGEQLDSYVLTVKRMELELAAEREKVLHYQDQIRRTNALLMETRQQLKITMGDLKLYVDRRDELARQLAAERDKEGDAMPNSQSSNIRMLPLGRRQHSGRKCGNSKPTRLGEAKWLLAERTRRRAGKSRPLVERISDSEAHQR